MKALVIGAAIAPDDISPLCDRVRRLMEDAHQRVIECDVAGVVSPDAATVDALARLQLTARRMGGEIRLRDASDELIDLIAFMGLAHVMRCEKLRLKSRGQSE